MQSPGGANLRRLRTHGNGEGKQHKQRRQQSNYEYGRPRPVSLCCNALFVFLAGDRDLVHAVSGGRELNHVGGQKGVWPAVDGGGSVGKWRPDAVVISVDQREAEG